MEGRKAETDLGRHGMLEARGESRRHRRQPTDARVLTLPNMAGPVVLRKPPRCGP